ncbi:EF-Hand 1 [Babesia duncani]|uniref:EF-Hand 1 n=1 Tax=Babesia duncani TaxID=323732 RepID=A0AAD9PNG0_9APIC|nr:EF-Hand 1 [Babesia duncani]KAK2197910.1 EF-Hand 1 [Babesia duncani]
MQPGWFPGRKYLSRNALGTAAFFLPFVYLVLVLPVQFFVSNGYGNVCNYSITRVLNSKGCSINVASEKIHIGGFSDVGQIITTTRPTLISTHKHGNNVVLKTNYNVPIAAATILEACNRFKSVDSTIRHYTRDGSVHMLNDICSFSDLKNENGPLSDNLYKGVAMFLQGYESGILGDIKWSKVLYYANVKNQSRHQKALFDAVKTISENFKSAVMVNPIVLSPDVILASEQPFKLLSDATMLGLGNAIFKDSISRQFLTFPQAAAILTYGIVKGIYKMDFNPLDFNNRDPLEISSILLMTIELIVAVSFNSSQLEPLVVNFPDDFTPIEPELIVTELFFQLLVKTENDWDFLGKLVRNSIRAKLTPDTNAKIPLVLAMAEKFACAFHALNREVELTGDIIQAFMVIISKFMFNDINDDGSIVLHEFLEANISQEKWSNDISDNSDVWSEGFGDWSVNQEIKSQIDEFESEYTRVLNDFLAIDSNDDGVIDFVEYYNYHITASLVDVENLHV